MFQASEMKLISGSRNRFSSKNEKKKKNSLARSKLQIRGKCINQCFENTMLSMISAGSCLFDDAWCVVCII